MNSLNPRYCPVCGKNLKLACPECGAEYPVDRFFSPYDHLSEDDAEFLQVFLSCRGSLKDVQAAQGISYPTAKKKLDKLLTALELDNKQEEEKVDMSIFKANLDTNSIKASDIIKNKLYQNGGRVTVHSARGNSYVIRASSDGRSILCDVLPPIYEFTVFDVIVDLLLKNGGKARKGNGRNYKLGEGDCTEDTVIGAIGFNYFGKQVGDSVLDPVFVMASVLEWADIAKNCRGYLELTPSYRAMLSR